MPSASIRASPSALRRRPPPKRLEARLLPEAPMISKRRLLLGLGGATAAATLLTRFARAAYPERAIKIIVPGSPGGPTDVMARLISQRLQQSLGQSVVVENRAGGGGSVAAKAAASAEPDGYTLLFCNTSI